VGTGASWISHLRDSSHTRLWETRSAAASRLQINRFNCLSSFLSGGVSPFSQSSPLWVLLVLVLYTGLLSLALQFTAVLDAVSV
jgi:hypothetical protein